MIMIVIIIMIIIIMISKHTVAFDLLPIMRLHKIKTCKNSDFFFFSLFFVDSKSRVLCIHTHIRISLLRLLF